MTPKKYRYKHTVEAVQWDGKCETAEYLRKRSKNKLYAHNTQDGWFLYLEGEDDLPLLINLGVYILITWDDNIELLHASLFERDYEPVDDLKGSNSTGLEVEHANMEKHIREQLKHDNESMSYHGSKGLDIAERLEEIKNGY